MVYLSAVFRRIEKQAPHLSYEIVPINSPLDHVRSGAVDLCITGNPYSQAAAAADHLLRADTLFSETYCCVVDDDHPLRGIITLEQLFEYPHIIAQFTGVTMQTSELRIGDARSRANPVMKVPSFNVIPALVRGTRAVGVLPSRMVDVAPSLSGMRTLAVAFEMPSFTEHLIWHSRFAYDPAFCWLRSIMLGTT
jgi:LysR family nod box-dependent transcriptional activator